jgi:hypothetical protein
VCVCVCVCAIEEYNNEGKTKYIHSVRKNKTKKKDVKKYKKKYKKDVKTRKFCECFGQGVSHQPTSQLEEYQQMN